VPHRDVDDQEGRAPDHRDGDQGQVAASESGATAARSWATAARSGATAATGAVGRSDGVQHTAQDKRTIVRSSSPRSDVLAFVAQNLRRLRRRAGFSQAALAEASGISRRMIVSLEGGETNISLSSLDHLAEALGASFVDLVSDPDAHGRRIDAVAWRGGRPESEAVLVASVPARREAQLWSWVLGPGDRYVAEPDTEGWHEMIAVTEGSLRIELEEGPVTVDAGGFAVYSSAQTYSYINVHEGVTRFIRSVVA
jgi:transcriptional regulator with XRE-family HTH domain